MNRKYLSYLLIVISILLFALSTGQQRYQVKLSSEVRRVQKALHKRQKIIEDYSLKALNSKEEWTSFDDLPDDMVLYCFQNDSLKSWTHQFPISNDDINASTSMYRLQSTGDRNLNSTPLAYIGVKEQYANLGSAWYIVNTQLSSDYNRKIVSGILVRTDYPSGYLQNRVNKHLRIGKGFTTMGINNDDSAIVFGREGEPLFSIVTDTPSAYDSTGRPLAWIAFALLTFAFFTLHFEEKSWKSFWILTGALIVVRIATSHYVGGLSDSGPIFSPIYYADGNLFNSLGSLLISTLLITLEIYGFFLLRYDIFRRLQNSSLMSRRLTMIGIAGGTVLLLIYFFLIARSLAINSNIVLEPFKLSELTLNSLLCFLAFAMLALAVIFMIQLLFFFSKSKKHFSMFSWKTNLIFVAAFSAFCLLIICIYGYQREYEINRVRTSKLATERDLSLEVELIDMDTQIENDSFVSVLASVKAMELIRNRLLERYFTNEIVQKYDIEITLCTPDNLLDLMTGAEPVGCFQFYDDLMADYGAPLYDGSHFLFINNYDGKTTYLGVFNYLEQTEMAISRLFIKLQSKYQNDSSETPLERLGERAPRNNAIPKSYSFAKYVNGRLVNSDGDYNYPISTVESDKTGYHAVKKKGYVHFVNPLSEEKTVVVSYSQKPIFSYIVSFSYFFIFFGLFIVLCTRWTRTSRWIDIPKGSLRRKTTFLITGAMVVALLSMGIGATFYVVRLNVSNLEKVTGERISTVRNALSPHCRYALRYNQIVTPEMLSAIDEVSKINRCDINLYDTRGILMVSTKPEIYEQFVAGKRINYDAYHAIVFEKSAQYMTIENIADLSFFSLYAPLFNSDGEMVAILNVPYQSSNQDVNDSAVATISTIINLSLILLLAAIVLGYVVSSSMVRPLAEIKNKLDRLALPGKSDPHIKYRDSKDELGILIASYNKMVDDLDESTRRLAQQEREQAWKEMARQIAHEIKNPLTPMKLSIQYLMRLKAENVPGWEEKLNDISRSLIEQIDTLSNTANEFSSFSKFFAEEISDVDIDKLIREEAVLFDNRDNISIRYLQNIENAVVKIRRNQLSRVLVNLISNSIQAIENSGQDTGHIKITLDECREGATPYYKISVEDNGPGVSDENLSKLFTPNFTTKSGGTGLGLAICKSIIEQSQGTISYSRSELGGACFTILLTQ